MCPCWRNCFKFLVFRELVTECLSRVDPNLKPLLEYGNTLCFLCGTSDQLLRDAEGAKVSMPKNVQKLTHFVCCFGLSSSDRREYYGSLS
jgi:hypothetical protein